jgi:hypothetical protein
LTSQILPLPSLPLLLLLLLVVVVVDVAAVQQRRLLRAAMVLVAGSLQCALLPAVAAGM